MLWQRRPLIGCRAGERVRVAAWTRSHSRQACRWNEIAALSAQPVLYQKQAKALGTVGQRLHADSAPAPGPCQG